MSPILVYLRAAAATVSEMQLPEPCRRFRNAIARALPDMVRLQGCRALCCGSTVTDNAHESTASVLPCTQPTLTQRISATETDAYSEGQGTSP